MKHCGIGFAFLLSLALPAVGATRINGHRVIEGTLNYCQDTSGTDAYACSLQTTISTYVPGACYLVMAGSTNIGPATLNLNGLGAIAIKKRHDEDLEDGDIEAGQVVSFCYDGTNMQMESATAVTAPGKTKVTQNLPFVLAGAAGGTATPLAWIEGSGITAGAAGIAPWQRAYLSLPDASGDLPFQVPLVLPAGWDGEQVDVTLYWEADGGADDEDVVWRLSSGCISNGDPLNTGPTLTDSPDITHDVGVSPANIAQSTNFSGVATSGCSAGEIFVVRLTRLSDDENDTLSASALAHMVVATLKVNLE